MISFHEPITPAPNKEDFCWQKISDYSHVYKGILIDDVGVSRDTAFQEQPGAGFETGDFVKKKLAGALP